ncbi:DNA replication and repair protein RecN [Verrucomicrobium sp. GAS474]|uniref:DNA repair protein RecN n=1 Tax=Verrucomicrobium sp. GAS474 TaxID=1882831 RepID=UPI000879C851|nr:DNA repair protein RecN [Verrucomicrobium sp. GAS474]SDU26426.1 DNA replication and repair protein RecN [Verrucomicrobium sp. GAS474]
MISSLRIKNLALIDDLRWEMGPGFNALTGETGAGKSILIDALMLLAGERADKTLIRSGETACSVEAEVALSGELAAAMAAILDDIGAEPCEDGVLLLKRTLSASGATGASLSNKQFANGGAVTLQALKRIGDLLVDLHGPHDHQSLLRTAEQLHLLDAHGKTAPLRAEVAKAHGAWREAAQRRAAMTLSEKERTERIDRLRHRVSEIENARLKPGEDAEVERDFKLANNSRQLLEWASTLLNLVTDGEGAVLGQLAQVEKTLLAWQKIDPDAVQWAEANHRAVAELQELASSVRDYSERVDLDGERLRQVEERMALLHGLKKKYGPSLDEVIATGAAEAEELKGLEDRDETLARLEKEEAAAKKALSALAEKLTAARKKTAKPLAESVTKELRGLGFKSAVFDVSLKAKAEPTTDGADEVEFLFAPNVGEATQPLRSIASSGEMARVMLAIKTTLAEVDSVPVLVFDEVDANVGGETAWEVGRKLARLGANGERQVLCITHQPQVAAQGKAHFHVEKAVKEGRTTTKLTELNRAARAKELARMLGGANKESLALAEKMLDRK